MMTRQIEFRRRAAFDVESVVVYLGEVRRNPKAAKKFYAQLTKTLQLLAETPATGKPFSDEVLDNETMRWHSSGRYKIFYTFDAETLTVWRVLHDRQDLDDFAILEF